MAHNTPTVRKKTWGKASLVEGLEEALLIWLDVQTIWFELLPRITMPRGAPEELHSFRIYITGLVRGAGWQKCLIGKNVQLAKVFDWQKNFQKKYLGGKSV